MARRWQRIAIVAPYSSMSCYLDRRNHRSCCRRLWGRFGCSVPNPDLAPVDSGTAHPDGGRYMDSDSTQSRAGLASGHLIKRCDTSLGRNLCRGWVQDGFFVLARGASRPFVVSVLGRHFLFAIGATQNVGTYNSVAAHAYFTGRRMRCGISSCGRRCSIRSAPRRDLESRPAAIVGMRASDLLR